MPERVITATLVLEFANDPEELNKIFEQAAARIQSW